MSEDDLRLLIIQVKAHALPAKRLVAIRKGLEIIANNLSAEISARYHLYREEIARLEAEERLIDEKKTLGLYRTLIDNVDDFVLMSDVEGQILAANRKAKDVLGYDESEITNTEARFLCLKDDWAALKEHAMEAVRNGNSNARIRLLTKDKRVIETEMNLRYASEGGTFQAILRDITERLRMENELRQRSRLLELQNKKVIKATQLKTRFLASMSHEFRCPLTSIIGFAEILLEDEKNPLTAKQRDHVLKVWQNARQLLQMVDELLDTSRIESGRICVNLSNVDVGRVIQDVAASMAPMLRGKNVILTTNVQSDLEPIRTDEQKFRQILTNLVSNAVKFTHYGSITVSAVICDGKVDIAVQDTGIGIRRTDFRRIFEDYEQADDHSTRRSKGTGLGLPLTKRLCHLLGGRIKVESRLGEGTTFTVMFPISVSQSVVQRRVRALKTGPSKVGH